MIPYQYRTTPFDHQREEFEKHREDIARAIFWEQGTGKTKLEADNIAWLWQQGKINAVLVIAPNGVHTNWISEELPKHLPESTLSDSNLFCYQTVKAKTKGFQRDLRAFWKHKGLAILAMSYDAIMTVAGRNVAWAILRDRDCLYIADESARIKTPSAKRTIRVVASAKYAAFRRILTGTPVANSPFDVYSQLRFLDDKFWEKRGISSMEGFKTQFGVWVTQERKDGKTYQECVDYQHLDVLKEMVDSISTRLTKDQVLDLPPKLYTKRYFELDNKQKKLYQELRDEFMTFLDGEMVSAPLAIVRLLRLQQICCGYLPPDDDETPVLRDISTKNPRMDLLKELVEDLPHKAIIWARFRRDIDQICAHLGDKAVRYDGSVDSDGRELAIARFQGERVVRGPDGMVTGKEPVPKGEQAQFFVANAQAAGEGLTLTAAQTVIYYSNSFKLTERLQSEDRAHRIGQEHPVNYIDLIASGTIDKYIVQALASKLDIASKITGDQVRTWL